MTCCLCNGSSASLFLEGGDWRFVRVHCGMVYTADFATRTTFLCVLAQAGFTELAFESRENHKAQSCWPKDLVIRLINAVATSSGRSEAMLLICAKGGR